MKAKKIFFQSNQATFTQKLEIDKSYNYTHVAVTSVSIPKTYYNIPRDCTLSVTEDSTITFITIPKGNYTFHSLREKLELGLANCRFQYRVNYLVEMVSNKYAFIVSNNDDVQPVFSTSDEYLANRIGLIKDFRHSFIGNELQFSSCPNFELTDILVILSNICRNQSNFLQEIYPSQNPPGSAIKCQSTNHSVVSKQLATNPEDLYTFSLCDFEGKEIDLNGSYWSFFLTFY